MRPERPNLRPERPGLRPKNLDLRSERPNLRLERPDLRPERLNLRPERQDLRPERQDLRPERPDLRPEGPEGGGQTHELTNGRTKVPLCSTGLRLPRNLCPKTDGYPLNTNPQLHTLVQDYDDVGARVYLLPMRACRRTLKTF